VASQASAADENANSRPSLLRPGEAAGGRVRREFR